MSKKFLSPVALTGITSGSILKVNSSGVIVAAVDGTDYNTGGSQWTTSGTNIYYTTGNVGIGATSIWTRLVLDGDPQAGTLNAGVALAFDGGSYSQYGYRFKANGANYYQVLYDGSGINWKHYESSTYVTKLTLTNSGSLGIGETSPDGLLHIKGSAQATEFYIESSTGTASTSGAIKIAQNNRSAEDFAGEMVFYVQDTNVGGLFWREAMTIINSGNVGIGNSSPGNNRLKVTGATEITGNLTLSGLGAGFLKTDANGAVSVDTNTYLTSYTESDTLDSVTDRGATTTNAIGTGNLTINSSSSATSYIYLLSSTTGESELRMGDTDTDAGSIAYNNNLDRMAFRTNAAERVYIDSSGNVGIGVSSPAQRLDVLGKMKITDDIILAQINGRIDYDNGNEGGALRFWSTSAASERMRITSAGNVGIGTTSPGGIFDVQQSSSGNILARVWNTNTSGTGSSSIRIANSGNNSYGSRLEFTDNDYYVATISGDRTQGLVFRTSATGTSPTGISEWMRITTSGNVGMGTTSPAGKLHVIGLSYVDKNSASAEPNVRLRTATDSYATEWGVGFPPNSTDFAVRRANASGWQERFRITDAGNVGIGTTSPAGHLHISASSDAHLLLTSDNAISIYQDAAWSSTMMFGAKWNGSGQVYGGTSRGAFKIVALHDADNSPQYLAIYGANQGTAGNEISWNSVGFAQDEDGNVGIGTTAPAAKLDVNGFAIFNADVNVQDAVAIYNYSPSNGNSAGSELVFRAQGQTGGVTRSSYWRQRLELDSAYGNSAFSISKNYDGAGYVEYIRINSSGNVGIGTTSPSQKLDVVGNIELGGGGNKWILTDETNTGTGRLGIQAGAGSAEYGGSIFLYAHSHASHPGDVVAGISSGSNGAFRVNTHGVDTGTDLFYVGGSSGNVGIGTTTPGSKLHVVGETFIDGTAYFDTDLGNQPFYITRQGAASESLKIYVDDGKAVFESIQDENGGESGYGSMKFILDAGDSGTMFQIFHGATERFTLDALGDLSIDGSLYVGGNVDGVDIAAFKTAYDSHTHSDATTSASGFMSSADKSKLDNIASGADAYAGWNISDGTATTKIEADDTVTLTAGTGISISNEGGVVTVSSTVSESDTLDAVTTRGATTTNAIETGNITISTSSPDLFFETGATHYNWMVAAQENVNAGFEISVGSQDADSSNDTWSPKLVILQSGNVGIGTTSPSYKLQVNGPSDNIIASFDHTSFVSRQVGLPGRFMVGPLGNGYPEIGYNFTTASSTYNKIVNDTAWSINFGNGSRMSFKYAGAGTGEFSFTERMVITTAGLVGIGTTSPSEKLHVSGRILDDEGYAMSHPRFKTIDSSNFFRLNDNSTVSDFIEQWGASSGGGGTITKVSDGTAPAEGCFEIEDDLYFDGGSDFIKVDTDADYTFEMYIKYVSGTDINSRLYLGWGMYDSSQTYYGNTQRYWGASALQVDADSYSNGDWVKVVGTISGVGTAVGNFISGTEYVKPLILLNYGGPGVVVRICGIKLYKSSNYQTKVSFVEQAWKSADSSNFVGSFPAIYHDGSTGLDFYANGAERLNLAGDVNVSGTTDLQITGTSRRMSFTSGTGTIRTTTSNALYLQTNSSTALTIDSSQNVGIGTTSPAKKLDVRGGYFITSDGGTNEEAFVQGGSGYAYFGNYSTGKAAFGNSENWTTLVADGGNVGIGTTSPDAKLHIVANDSTIATLESIGSNANSKTLIIQSGGDRVIFDVKEAVGGAAADLAFELGNSEVMRLSDTGNVGIGTTSPAKKLVVAASSQTWGGAPQIAFYDTTSGQTGARNWTVGAISTSWGNFTIASSTAAGGDPTLARLTITNAGNVGIGTTSPSYKLDVNGSFNCTSMNVTNDITTSAGNVVLANDAGIYSLKTGTITAGNSSTAFRVSNTDDVQAARVTFVVESTNFQVAKIYEVVKAGTNDPVAFKVVDTGPSGEEDFSVAFSNDGGDLLCTVTNDSSSASMVVVSTIFLGGSYSSQTVSAS